MHHTQRWTSAAAATLLAFILATGCAPEPAPSPSANATGFAAEEEAFAAAEATYRKYIAAVNARRENPDSSPDPIGFLKGEARSDEFATERLLAERGWRISGETMIASLMAVRTTSNEVTVLVCLDASATRIFDSAGSDVTPADRAVVLGLDVGLELGRVSHIAGEAHGSLVV